MKKTTILVIVLLGLVCAALSAADGVAQSELPSQSAQQLYTCGMHPQIVSTEPGLCPICHMKLVPKKGASGAAGTVVIDPTTRQNMGIKTEAARLEDLTRTVRAFGRVAIPDPNFYSINVKVSGWVEKLYINEEGERAFNNQPLLEIYSPDLVTAQKEYLIAWRTAASQKPGSSLNSLLTAAEERLRNWDISDDQLTRLRETGQVSRTLMLRSPTDGFVLRKMVNAGDRVGPGMTLYEIGDLSTVWVKAFVYEQDLPFVSIHDEASVTFPNMPGEAISSKIIYVSPMLSDQRQVEIRLQLDNSSHRLRPDMYAEVALHSRIPGQRLTVPRAAVINSGTRQVAYVAAGDGSFEPRQITTGLAGDGDRLEVKGGLAAGEEVVTSGQFMLDSEARLSEALAGAGHQHGSGEEMTMPPTSDGRVHDDTGRANHKVAAGADDPYNIHTCPMPVHFHVLNYGPGSCSECGMDLVPLAQTDNTEVYVCPMPQCRVATDQPGTCPVCNMELLKYVPGGHRGQ